MKNKIITLLTALSMVSVASTGFVTVASAANEVDNEISVANAVQTYKMVYNKDLSSETVKYVDVYTDNFAPTESYLFAVEISLQYDADVVKSVRLVDEALPTLTNGTKFNPLNEVKDFWSLSGTGDLDVSADPFVCRFEFTTAEDAQFDVSLARTMVSVYDEVNDVENTDIVAENVQTLTVPKFVTDTKPEAQVVNATMKHSQNDELSTENEAQYWLAEFTPTAAFNTLTVVATDVDGNTTAPVSKTETMVSGESSMFVQVLVKNVTKAVQSVVVTASVE